MISNAATRSTGNRSSRTSITLLHPAPQRPAVTRTRGARLVRHGLLRELMDTLRMAVGIDDEHEDYECLR